MKLKTKNLLMILLPVLVLFSAVMGYSMSSQYRTDKKSSETMAEMTSRQYGDRVAAFLESPLDAARTIADMTAGYVETGTADRKAVDAALKKILETNEDFFGVWVGFEPNAFDAKDASYANTGESDATGRYIPYWYREGSGVALAVLENYTATGDGDYYQLAFQSGNESILEPFSYEVGGKTVQMTSLTVPIYADGKVVGVAGVDISLEKLQQITDELELYKTGFGRLLTGTGTVVTHHDQTLVGSMGEEFENGDPDGLIARINNEDTFSQPGKLFKSYAPIDIGRTGSHWCFGTVIPQKEILAELNTTMGLLLLIALVGLGALAGVIVFISASISAPIIATTGIIQRLSGFDFRSDGPSAADRYAKREDEIGVMLQSIQSMQRNMQANLLEKLSNISRGDLDDDIVVLGGQDQIGPALADTQNAIKSLVSDVNALAGAAVEGRLDARADAGRHQGQYAKVVDGVNRTLDAVVAPVTEAGNVLDKMANGDLTVRMDGDYRGDHAAIKVALNSTLDSVSTYVGEISGILTQMAGANFKVGVEADYKGDFAPIKTALNLIVETFNKVLAEMNTAAEQVSIGSRQVSEGSQALSQGATEQASSIEQLTASIRVVADQTRDNAVHAGTAHQLSSKTKLQATQGSDVMKQMRTAMAEISESSSRIAQVIKVIDDIAFQTNMLSLNAAVEAARAGANGKGFAVVAEEVRDLAGRCAKAAKETAAMIEESIAKVNTGSKLTEKTARALDEIVSEVVQVESLVGTIAEASNDQASAITEINQGVMQVSEVVRMNSSTSEESAATSEELSGQADMLKQMIARFKLK